MTTTQNQPDQSGGNRKTDQLTEHDLAHFTGDLVRIRHGLNRQVIYTPGVRHVVEKGQACWLIDAIASWIGSNPFNEAVTNDPRIGDLHFWTFEKQEDQPSILYAKADSPEEPFICQLIEFTDFPLDKINIWAGFDGSYWTLYLPSEH